MRSDAKGVTLPAVSISATVTEKSVSGRSMEIQASKRKKPLISWSCSKGADTYTTLASFASATC